MCYDFHCYTLFLLTTCMTHVTYVSPFTCLTQVKLFLLDTCFTDVVVQRSFLAEAACVYCLTQLPYRSCMYFIFRTFHLAMFLLLYIQTCRLALFFSQSLFEYKTVLTSGDYSSEPISTLDTLTTTVFSYSQVVTPNNCLNCSKS